jgi:hypothetical protein
LTATQSRLSVRQIPDGKPGIAITLQRMALLAREGVRNERILTLSREITRGLPVANKMAEAAAIFEWAKANLRYIKDPFTVEFIMHPERLLAIGQGDCDDLSIFLGSMFESIGIPSRFVAVQTREVGKFNHVYAEAWLNGRWVAFDLANVNPQIDRPNVSIGEKMIQAISIDGEPQGDFESFQNNVRVALSAVGILVIAGIAWIMFRLGRKSVRHYAS